MSPHHDEVIKVVYNWGFCSKNGEIFYSAEVGIDGVVWINYVTNHKEHYCDIWHEDEKGGRIVRVFNINRVVVKLPS